MTRMCPKPLCFYIPTSLNRRFSPPGRCENIKFQEPEMVPVDVGKKYRNYFLQDVVMRKMEKVFSKVPQGEQTWRDKLRSEILGNGR